MIDPTLKKFESEILNIFLELGNIKGIPEAQSILISYLYLLRDFTQSELKQISHVSLANISVFLQNEVEYQFVKKIQIPGTHTFRYKLNASFERMLSISFSESSRMLQNILIFLEKKLTQIESYKKQNLTGYDLLYGNLIYVTKNIRLFHEIMQKLMDVLQNNSVNPHINLSQNNFVYHEFNPKEYHYIEFDPQLKIIENEIVAEFQSTSLHRKKNPLKSQVIPYFLTRGMLTQKDLQKISGLSSGLISKSLQFMVDRKYITLFIPSPNNHERKVTGIYVIRSILFLFLYQLTIGIEIILDHRENVLSFKKELEKNLKNWENLAGYASIIELYNDLVQIFPKYELFQKIFIELQNKIEQLHKL